VTAVEPFDPGSDCDDGDAEVYPGSARNEQGDVCTPDADGDGYGDVTAEEPFDQGSDCDDDDASVYPSSARNEQGDVCTPDSDGDGYGAVTAVEPFDPGSDCDDGDAEVYPGSAQFEDSALCVQDSDGDGYGDRSASFPFEQGRDCDDTNAIVYPGSSLEQNPLLCVQDSDGDGYGDINAQSPYDSGTDCDDSSELIYALANEICDGQDNNCNQIVDGFENGLVSEVVVDAAIWYVDSDGDGVGTSDSVYIPVRACSQPEGYSSLSTDCDDDLGSVYPNAPEYCNGIDDDCDGDADEGEGGLAPVDADFWYLDADEDGYGNPQVFEYKCEQSEGYVSQGNDCEDDNPDVNPSAEELCSTDGDDDCDGEINENTATDVLVYYLDADEDGYGVEFFTQQACSRPAGFAVEAGDCDDADALARPGLIEYCNGKDDDCDSLTDELPDRDPATPAQDTVLFYPDFDGDQFGDASSSVSEEACPNDVNELGSGVSDNNLDCDDTDDQIHPEALEDCAFVDRNCDGDPDLGAMDPIQWFVDSDGDQFGDSQISFEACSAPVSFVSNSDDCDDLDANTYPNAPELCNGKLENCNTVDGLTQDPVTQLFLPDDEWDDDGDNRVECTPSVSLTAWRSSQTQVEDIDGEYISGLLDGNDCDDSRNYVYDGAPEMCNGQYDDCSSRLEYDDEIPPDEWDDDEDTYVECSGFQSIEEWFGPEVNSFVDADGNLFPKGGDCRDDDPFTYPGAVEDNSQMRCRTDIDDGNGGEPDGVADCMLTECDYALYFDDDSGPDFVLISNGDGTPLVDPLERYTLSNDFFIMTTEMTYDAYVALVEPETEENIEYYRAAVSNINWNKAAYMANQMTIFDNFSSAEQCYVCEGEGDNLDCAEDPKFYSIYDCPGYRLPTEAEWELAGRSGTTENIWTGTGENLGGTYWDGVGDEQLYWEEDQCNSDELIYDGDSNPQASLFFRYCGVHDEYMTVAQFLSNDYGLYDMHGNVREWTTDYSSWEFPFQSVDPWWFDVSTDRVTRGGTKWDYIYHVGFEHRYEHRNQIDSDELQGFRIVRTAPQDVDEDGVTHFYDCDDTDSSDYERFEDCDSDGVLTEDDCDDFDSTLGASSDDEDCDGVLTEDDCDDSDFLSFAMAEDSDCDGVPDDCFFGGCDYAIDLGNDIGVDFVEVSTGNGEVLSDPLERYTLTNGFYMMTTEVTIGIVEELGGYDPTLYLPDYGLLEDGPAYGLNWHMSAALANDLTAYENQETGSSLEECYSCTGSFYNVECYEDFSDIYACSGYRLPTDAEWEYAARSGTSGEMWTGQGEDQGGVFWYGGCDSYIPIIEQYSFSFIDDFAWWCADGLFGPKEVGLLRPNGFGLYDMHGNIKEWTGDWAAEEDHRSGENPWFVEGEYLEDRILRGGAWYSDTYEIGLQSLEYLLEGEPDGNRSWGYQFERYDDIGVRLVRTIE
ncbi:MAG: hypothetical protein CMK59_03895, partial [Proteobacteria bacterium]|nr:hypothetical protein [Pseudomonadota bacterium]